MENGPNREHLGAHWMVVVDGFLPDPIGTRRAADALRHFPPLPVEFWFPVHVFPYSTGL